MDGWVKEALVSTALRDTPRSPWSLTRASGMSDVLFLPRNLFGLARFHKNSAPTTSIHRNIERESYNTMCSMVNILLREDNGKAHSVPLPLQLGCWSRLKAISVAPQTRSNLEGNPVPQSRGCSQPSQEQSGFHTTWTVKRTGR